MSEESFAKIVRVWSQAIADLEPHTDVVARFVYLVEKIDGLADMERRFHREGLSLYHAISKNRTMAELEEILMIFFENPPEKIPPDGNAAAAQGVAAQHLGGLQPGQSLFTKAIGAAEFYGALWPWKEKKDVVTVHMGVCAPDLTDEDHQAMYLAFKGHLTDSTSEMVDAGVSGRIQGVSLSSFLQMSEMDGSTCTLRIREAEKEGALHLLNGNLIDAETGNLKHREAAFAILRWEHAEIEILKPSGRRKNEIGMPLMQLLMEALKEKDESEFYQDTQHDVSLPDADPFDIEAPPSTFSMEDRGQPAAAAEAGFGKSPAASVPQQDGAAPGESVALKQDRAAGEEGPGADSRGGPAKAAVPAEEGTAAGPEGLARKGERPGKKALAYNKPGFPRKKKKVPMVAAAIGVAALLCAGVFLYLQGQKAESAEKAYATLLNRLARIEDGDEKVKRLNAFIDAHQDDAVYAGRAVEKLLAVLAQMEDEDYKQAVRSVYELPSSREYYRNARAIFSAFLAKHPDSRHRPEISEKLSDIAAITESAYFSELGNMDTRDFVARLEAYGTFLAEYPQGRHKAEVEQLMVQTLKASFRDFLDEITACRNSKAWDTCVSVCRQYRQTYGQYMKMDTVDDIEKEVLGLKALETLKAETEGADDATVLQRYRAFLEAYPDTPERERLSQRAAEIEGEMAVQEEWARLKAASQDDSIVLSQRIERLERYIAKNPGGPYAIEAENLKWRLEQPQGAGSSPSRNKPVVPAVIAAPEVKKAPEGVEDKGRQFEAMLQKLAVDLKQTRGRFTLNQDGTVIDSVSGLAWTALDSSQVSGGCLNYREAVRFVSRLTDGGHQDWRLPTSAELAGIYQNRPYFPAADAEWYWSSEVYEKGYQTIVNIVSVTPEKIYRKKTADVGRCGAVRAVRP